MFEVFGGDNLRKPKHRDNRDDILQSTFEYLTKSGLENISIRDLCEGTGISIGSIYYWFEDKEQLICETAGFGLLKVSDDIFSRAFETVCDLNSSFEACIEKMKEHQEALRFIYQLACSPVYGSMIRKMCEDLEHIYQEYAVRISSALDLSIDYTMPLVSLFVSAVLDFALWGNSEQTKAQLDFIYKKFTEGKK